MESEFYGFKVKSLIILRSATPYQKEITGVLNAFFNNLAAFPPISIATLSVLKALYFSRISLVHSVISSSSHPAFAATIFQSLPPEFWLVWGQKNAAGMPFCRSGVNCIKSGFQGAGISS